MNESNQSNMGINIKNRAFWPETIFVTDDTTDDPITKRVISRLKDVEIIRLKDRTDPLISEQGDLAARFTKGKRKLLLTRHLGAWLERCPGTQEHVCCNLWIVNPGEGCPMDCTYCYLQSYLIRNPTMKIFTNTSEMLKEIKVNALKDPGRLFRVGTGEVMDSLVWDELTDLTLELVPFFASIPNLMLELKSKSDYVDNLLTLKNEHNNKTVVSWSVNAPEVSAKDEAFTASLEDRILAAEKVIEAGYRVGFHFDPLIYFDGYEDSYRDTIRKIFKNIAPKDIAWISLSTLRYKPEMQRTMIERFPNSKIPFGEQILGKDNKLRYAQPIRFELQNFIWKELQAISKEMPLYMCMESSAAWREISGGPPGGDDQLVEIFSRSGKVSRKH
jgi:spore photoproduct lyase